MGFLAGDESRLTGGADTTLNGTVFGLSGSDQYLAVGLELDSASTAITVTCNGSGMTLIDQTGATNGRILYVYRLASPTAGTLTASWTTASVAWMGWMAFDNITAYRAGSFNSFAGAPATVDQVLDVTTTAGDIVVDFCAPGFGVTAAIVAGTGSHTVGYTPGTQNGITLYGGYATAADTSYPAAWTLSDTDTLIHHAGIALEPTGGGGGGSLGFRPYYLGL